MKNLIDKASVCHKLSKSEITAILEDNSINEYLFRAADEVRRKYIGDEVYLRALIEFSNICRCNCFYCGLRAANKDVERYRLSEDEILNCAKHAISQGYKTIVLQSGEDLHFSAEALADIIKEIKSNTPRPAGERVELLNEQHEFSNSGEGDNVAITLSIGERTFDEYKILKDAGADRFLLRIETTNPDLYSKMHPGMNLESRKRCLCDLKKLGFETGTGSLIGLPGQTAEDLADDILFYKELNADMIGVGPLITHERTPLAGLPNGDLTLALKVMALTRLLLPDINIPATTAMETLCPDGRILALKAGANVVMPNVTDNMHKKNYEIYPGKVSVDYAELEEKLKQIGRKISTCRGFRGNSQRPLTLPSPVGRGPKILQTARLLRKRMTPQERKLWNIIRNNQLNNRKFKRQYPLGKYIVDFICMEKLLIIEIDGGGHNDVRTIKYDKDRTEYLNSRGFRVIRFWNDDITYNIDSVVQEILKYL